MLFSRSSPRPTVAGTGRDMNNNPIRRIYLPEDIDEDDRGGYLSVNKCTLEIQSLENPDFDYIKYEEFCYLRSLQFRLLRLRNERASKGAKEPLTSQPSPAFLKQLFVERYGPVDFNDPLMIKRLEVMKDSLVEIATQPLDEEKIMNQLLDESIEGPDGDFWICDDQYDDDFIEARILDKFTMEEIEMFGSLKPADAGSEWFHLPRGDLSYIREVQFPAPKDDQISKGPLKELCVYDPKFEYCFTPPYRILNTCDESGIEDLGISRLAAFRILQHLNQFSNGVTRNVFWETYYVAHGNFLQIPGLTIFQVFDYLPGEVLIVPKTETFPELLFPGFLEGAVDPQLILKRVWHAIMCVLSKKPYIESCELMQRVENEFGFRFDHCHWGFNCVAGFLKWCLELFGLQNALTVRYISFIRKRVTIEKNYFCLKVPHLLKEMDRIASGVLCGVTIIKPIPECCAGQDYKITYLADQIGQGETRVMELIALYDPRRLMFQDIRCALAAETFQRSLQIFPCQEQINLYPRPLDSQLAPGMYVMVHLTWKAKEWYRARIIWKNAKTAKYYVYGIDAGFLRHVPLTSIRFMPLLVARQPAFAVPTRLMLGRVTKARSYKWEARVATKMLDEFLIPYLLAVKFQRSKTSDALGCEKWVMTASVVKRLCGSFVIEHFSLTITLYTKLKEEVKRLIAKEDAEKAARKELQAIAASAANDAEATSVATAEPLRTVKENKNEQDSGITPEKKEGREGVATNSKSRMI